ncbi:hypothetical protein F66182_9482, partial [Fusarium sp. NRRL 66182]
MPPVMTESDPPASSRTEPLACVSCRARKLKCDRQKPACARCVKVSNECVYPESRRKPTFKRRNVKELEARLAQVEDYLKEVNKNSSEEKTDDDSSLHPNQPDMPFADVDFPPEPPQTADMPCFATPNDFNSLMSLGMSEPLPPDHVMEELNTIFFQSAYRMVPIIHPGNYMKAFYGPLIRRPPMCLRYAIWALAAVGNPKYDEYHDVFYRRARQSSLSVANAVRLCHMTGLDRLDGDSPGMAPPLGPAITWAELEERRRIFWGVFAADSHCCISTGWPSLINSEDVATRLPASEEAFMADRKEEAPFL